MREEGTENAGYGRVLSDGRLGRRANDGRLVAHRLRQGGYGCVLPDGRFAECSSWGEVQRLALRHMLRVATGIDHP